MADGSHIEWTDATWNPLVGCTKVSPGCDNCYAQGEVTRRHAAALSAKTSPKMLEAFPTPFETVSVRPDRFLLQPLAWRRPRRIFVNSLSDLFHADVPDDFIVRVFAVMAIAQRHTFQLLTKRHARMRSLLSNPTTADAVRREVERHLDQSPEPIARQVAQLGPDFITWPLPNVWLGVSVEDQHWADIRLPALLATPAAVRWISAEPLLGPIDLNHIARVGDTNGGWCAVAALGHRTVAKPITDPLGTITTQDHHWLVIPYRRGAKAHRPDATALSTVATREQHGLLAAAVDLEDCYFRMLQPREHLRAQRFPDLYVVHGNKGEQTMQAGNAVSSNVAHWIGKAVIRHLDAA